MIHTAGGRLMCCQQCKSPGTILVRRLGMVQTMSPLFLPPFAPSTSGASTRFVWKSQVVLLNWYCF